MKLFKRLTEGGPESPVIGFFLVEIKSMFSVVILHFGGTREAFHSHAFNALTFWMRGQVREVTVTECGWRTTKVWKAGQWKLTLRETMHKVIPITDAWAISFRGPWADRWQELKDEKYVTLTHGRKIVS